MNQRKGKKGKGVAYLAVARHRSHAGARGKERPAGGSARRDPATGAPRPGRSTAARSPAGERARRRGGRRRRRGSLISLAVEAPRSVSAAAGLSGEERAVRGEERESEGRMALGQGRRDGRRGFDPTMRAGSRRMETDGHERVGQVVAQAGARTRGTLPAQAQVAA